MDKIDQAIKGAIAAALVGLFTWCFNMNADVKINANDIKHISSAQVDQTEAIKALTSAVVDLRVYLAAKQK